jgi:hypothetical protein
MYVDTYGVGGSDEADESGSSLSPSQSFDADFWYLNSVTHSSSTCVLVFNVVSDCKIKVLEYGSHGPHKRPQRRGGSRCARRSWYGSVFHHLRRRSVQTLQLSSRGRRVGTHRRKAGRPDRLLRSGAAGSHHRNPQGRASNPTRQARRGRWASRTTSICSETGSGCWTGSSTRTQTGLELCLDKCRLLVQRSRHATAIQYEARQSNTASRSSLSSCTTWTRSSAFQFTAGGRCCAYA